MKNIKLDRLDIRILQALQRDGALSNQELAERVGLTAAPCLRRVKQLQDSGIIRTRKVVLDQRLLNLRLTVILHISMDKHIPERFDTFEQAVRNIAEVQECFLITGNDADYQLKIVVPDMDSYHDILLGQITRIPGVSGVNSSFVMRTVTDQNRLPLTYAALSG